MLNFETNIWTLLFQDGNVFCIIEPACGLDELLHENAYWEQQQQQYFEARTTINDENLKSESESTKEYNNTPFPVTEVTQPTIFLEKITIPESDHDTVTTIYSEKVTPSPHKYLPYRLKSRHKATNAKNFRNIKFQEKGKKDARQTDPIKTKSFEFSNELIQRYISVHGVSQKNEKTSE